MNCEYCKEELIGIFIGTGSGQAHPKCYWEKRPYVPKRTFREVLNNFDDPVIMRDMVEHYMPEQLKQRIVEEFNAFMEKRQSERIENK